MRIVSKSRFAGRLEKCGSFQEVRIISADRFQKCGSFCGSLSKVRIVLRIAFKSADRNADRFQRCGSSCGLHFLVRIVWPTVNDHSKNHLWSKTYFVFSCAWGVSATSQLKRMLSSFCTQITTSSCKFPWKCLMEPTKYDDFMCMRAFCSISAQTDVAFFLHLDQHIKL